MRIIDIGGGSIRNPPICPPISPPAKSPREKATRSPSSVFPGRPTLIYGVREFWLSIRARIWSSPGRIFAGFPPHARFTLSDLLFRNQNTRCGTGVRRCNEAAVFDAPHKVSGTCVGTATPPTRPLLTLYVFAPVPESVGVTP